MFVTGTMLFIMTALGYHITMPSSINKVLDTVQEISHRYIK